MRRRLEKIKVELEKARNQRSTHDAAGASGKSTSKSHYFNMREKFDSELLNKKSQEIDKLYNQKDLSDSVTSMPKLILEACEHHLESNNCGEELLASSTENSNRRRIVIPDDDD